VAAELEKALSKVAVHGSIGVAKLECIAACIPRSGAGYTTGRPIHCPLWTITW